jgi:hypothetical protein
MRALLALLVCATLARADDGWKPVGVRDGITVEYRQVDGAPVREVRASTHSPLPPARIMKTLWRHEDYVQFVPYIKRLDILREDADTKLLYEQLNVPLLKDRDVTVRVTRRADPGTGTYEMTTEAAPDDGPPVRPDYVRVRTSKSLWRLVPATDGGTDVSYALRTDAGGLVPVWMANLAQKDATARFVRAVLERAGRNTP